MIGKQPTPGGWSAELPAPWLQFPGWPQCRSSPDSCWDHLRKGDEAMAHFRTIRQRRRGAQALRHGHAEALEAHAQQAGRIRSTRAVARVTQALARGSKRAVDEIAEERELPATTVRDMLNVPPPCLLTRAFKAERADPYQRAHDLLEVAWARSSPPEARIHGSS